MIPVDQQDGAPSTPTSSGDGMGYNQTPHQYPYSPAQQPPQGHGGHTTGLSHSASVSSSYSNATASWKKRQTGVMGLAKGTVDKFAGKEARKSVQASVQSAWLTHFFYFILSFLSLGRRDGGEHEEVWVG